jgi:hypothetical protein
MEQEKSRSLWELLSDVFREVTILLWVFGVILDHEHTGYRYGIVMGVGGMVLFIMSLIFEKQRNRPFKKGSKC